MRPWFNAPLGNCTVHAPFGHARYGKQVTPSRKKRPQALREENKASYGRAIAFRTGAMPFAQRLAAQIVQLDAKLLARATATIAQVAQRIEASMAAEMSRKIARSPGLG
jgi:hypothetical protein